MKNLEFDDYEYNRIKFLLSNVVTGGNYYLNDNKNFFKSLEKN